MKCCKCDEPAVVDLSWFDGAMLKGGKFCRRHAQEAWRSLRERSKDTALIEAVEEDA